RLRASRTALVVVDVQGSFPTIAHDADDVLVRLRALLDRARTAAAPVVFTRQRFADRIPGIVPTIGPTSGDTVVFKDSPDAFDGTDLSEVLAAVSRIAIAGFATEACIDSTARAALSRGFDVLLLSDCHTTTNDRGKDPVPAPEVIAHYNATFARLEYPGRSIIVAPSRRVAFV
ncbi:isochorismatase family protein, partial [Tsukamurella paurometabola]|nr:isochorismatase family protein [Tsukamurella paurometabola]